MMKSLILFPLLINLMMILLMMTPSKMMKFHPLSFMIILIVTTFIITLKMNFIFKSWISLILFLTMIGGLMIIFMYITSLTNNNFFFFNLKMILMNFLKSLIMILLMLMIYLILKEWIYYNFNLNLLYYNNLFMPDQINMNFLYKKYYNKSTIFIMMYLYYTMIIIMNICFNYKSPLRQNLF